MVKVRDRHGPDGVTYLGFNTRALTQLKFSDNVTINGYEVKYIGEWSAQTDSMNGRGIAIYGNGFIWIGQWKDGARAAGPYISISSGRFDVGEAYADANRI